MAQIFVNVLISTSLYLLVASSFSLIYFPAKIFHMAHAAVITTAAYFVYLFTFVFFDSLPFSLLIGIAVATIIGILFESLAYRPMRKKNFHR
jgi:branched-chain amino acid transport system permease protein